ncbi:hypothetical protein GQ473_07670 [archaeon]|nr:hypothetical protein [archaeon]
MNVFIEEDFSVLNKIQFFTAKKDNKGRFLIPGFIRRNLGIKFNTQIRLGIELCGVLRFYKLSVDSKGRIYCPSIKSESLLSVELVDSRGVFN